MIHVEAGAMTPSGPSNSASASRSSAAIFGLISSIRSSQRRSTSPAGPERHVELDRLVEVVADLDREVAALQRDLLEPGKHQLLADGVGARHRERPGAAGRLVGLLRVIEVLVDDLLGAPDPLVVELAPPDD